MPAEHLDGERLAAYRRQSLTPGELLAVDDHLAVCDACRGRLEPAKQLHTVFQSVNGALMADADAIEEHVQFDQLAAYVDNTIFDADRERVDAHVEICRTCADELRDLQTFSGRMATTDERVASAIAARPTVKPATRSSGSPLERVRDWLWGVAALSSPALQFALGGVVLTLAAVLIWEQVRYDRLEQQSVALSGSAEVLRKENESLRATAESLEARNRSLVDRSTEVNKVTGPATQSGIDATNRKPFQDTAGTASIGAGETVMLAQVTLPPELSASVRTLLTTGEVSPVASAVPKLMALRGDVTRSTLRAGQRSTTPSPVPISPVLTAIRSATPTLGWKAIPSALEYKVTVADEDGNVVWQSSAGTQTRLSVPPGTLQRGRVYFWQVEGIGTGESGLSPPVGFWLLDQRALREIEGIEQAFENSALVRASAYAAHGLYDEALTQVGRLALINPGNRQVERLRGSLRRQLGQE